MLGVTIALAASGDLDTTFDGDGKVTTDISGGREDTVNEIAIQTDGKIVVVGHRDDPVRLKDFAVVRYNSNGSLDTTFSGDGKLLTNFGAIEYAEDVAVQPDGKILVGGVDATPDALAEVAKGTLAVTVFQNARGQARGALDAAVRLSRGERVDSFVSIPFELVTRENYKSFLNR